MSSDTIPRSFSRARGPARGGGPDATWLARYNDWQEWARWYARHVGVARFNAAIVADTISRVVPRVEEYTGTGDWVETTDPALIGIFDEYGNHLQSPNELVRYHAWHYVVAAEMYQTMRDTPQGVEWGISSAAAVEVNKPAEGQVTIKLTPNGKAEDDTAFVVPANQAVRFWIPDEEWALYASGPMAASIDDLHRYRALARYAKHTADSQLAMNGMYWFPDDGWSEPPHDDEDGDDVGTPRTSMDDQYYQIASQRFNEGDDITGVAPHLVHWNKDLGPPVRVEGGTGLDPQGIAYRQEALEDFARGQDPPSSILIGGGPGDANHWTEWLNADRFAAAIAPTADRIFHQDLTRTFLHRRLMVAGGKYSARAGLYRIGYDASPVIIRQDQSDKAERAWLDGLLGASFALEHMGFDKDELATPEDLDRLFSVLSAKKAADSPFAKVTMSSPVGGDNVSQAPPSNGTAPPAPNGSSPPATPVRVAAVLGRALLAYSEEQARDEHGRFGSGGDGISRPSGGKGTEEEPFRVKSAELAQTLIQDGKFVEMPSDQVSILLDRLAAISQEARTKGEKAPLYDLCKVSVPDTNMFCEGNKGIPRAEMPQLAGIAAPGTAADALPKDDKGETDITEALKERLSADGYAMDAMSVPADTLKATQNELNGAKVAGMMKALEAGKLPPAPIFVSRDNYVVDGHHRWAANTGAGFVGGEPLPMDVIRVDMPIAQLIGYVNDFSTELGMQQMAAALRAR